MSQNTAEIAALKETLVSMLEMIRKGEAELPDMIADAVPTAPYRNKVRHFIAVLGRYIVGLDEKLVQDGRLEKPDEQGSDDPCPDRSDFDLGQLQFYENALRGYLVGLMNPRESYPAYLGNPTLCTFSPSQLATLLQGVQSTGELLATYIRQIGLPFQDISPQMAFNLVFGNILFGYVPSRAGTAQTVAGSNPMSRETIYILMDDSSFIDFASLSAGFVVVHEIGHAFHNRHGGRTDNDLAPIAASEFVRATGGDWAINGPMFVNYSLNGRLDPYMSPDGSLHLRVDGTPADPQDDSSQWAYILPRGSYVARGYDGTSEIYFPNELSTNPDAAHTPSEGFADTFANFVLNPDVMARGSRRRDYFDQNMPEWVRDIVCRSLGCP